MSALILPQKGTRAQYAASVINVRCFLFLFFAFLLSCVLLWAEKKPSTTYAMDGFGELLGLASETTEPYLTS